MLYIGRSKGVKGVKGVKGMSEVNPWSRDDVFLKENGFWDMLADYIGGQIRVIRVDGKLDALFATRTEA